MEKSTIKKEKVKLRTRKTKALKNAKGITLLALVITIIIIIILSTVAINFAFGDNGLIRRAEQAKNMAEESIKEEESALSSITDYIEDNLQGTVISEDGFDEAEQVNAPKLRTGMIPVYYDEAIKGWRKADENNAENQWYDYDAKKWANIVTVSDANSNLRTAEVGTEIPMEDITTFFVWIPRYAYSITSGYKQGEGATGEISVTFLKGNTNTGVDDVNYPTDYDESTLNPGDETPKIVHPGFKMGNRELSGIWVAKFEASGTNTTGEAVGNCDGEATYNPVAADDTTYVKILPSVPSWRNITIGESEYRSMEMSTNQEAYGWTEGVNSHLMRNSEWGAVAYLCYSDYGSIPKTNGSGTYKYGTDGKTVIYYYNLYTGAGPKATDDEGPYDNFSEETYGYNTELGVLASTTGNEYGVYDMAGGSWERVAAYLDNGNGNLDNYGKSTSNTSVVYFENGKLKSEYSSLWEAYEVSDEEKNNKIKVGEEEISQTELWDYKNENSRSIEYNEARYRLTEYNFKHMPKGIGVNETTDKFSYYAPYGAVGNNTYDWFNEVKDTTNRGAVAERTWNSDYTLIGHASYPFVYRGGGFDGEASAGVLSTSVTSGGAHVSSGFRPALAF